MLAVVVAIGGTAWAAGSPDEDRVEGRRRFQKGEEAFARGQFTEAMREYEAGYHLTRLPGFLINIAHCHRLSGDLRRARGYYRKYLLVAPTTPRRAEVEEIITDLDRGIAADEAEGPTGGPGAPRKPKIPSVRWWLWSALAGSVVGRTVATMSLATAEERRPAEAAAR